MSTKKKVIIGISVAVVVIALIVGIVFIVKKTTGKEIPVVPVSDMSWGYWGSDVNISGTVTSNASQEVHLNDRQIVDEVYVKEGDMVEVGTPLLSFDMTMTTLNLESEKLNKEGLEIQKAGLEGEINRLKKKTPISQTSANAASAQASWSTMTYARYSMVPAATENGSNTESELDFNSSADAQHAVYGGGNKVTAALMAAASGNLPVVITEEGTGNEVGNTSDGNTAVTPGGNPGGNTDVTPGGNSGQNPGGNAGGNPSQNPGGNTGQNPTETPTPGQTPPETPTPTPGENPTETPTPTPGETPVETPPETPTPTPTPSETLEPTPTPNPIPAYELIDGDSEYNGEGTKEKPRFYLGKNNEDYQVKLAGSFLNQAKAGKLCFWLELREEDKVDGALLAAIYIDGSRLLGEYDDTKTYLVRLYVIEELILPEEFPDDMGGIGGGFGGFEEGYTQEELNRMISEKQKELRSLNLDIRQCELTIAQIEKSLNDQEVKSTVTGIVKSVGDPEKGEVNGQAFIVVESTEGLYVQGTLSELMLGQISEGQMLMGNSYESGMSFEAEIREISPYPVDGNYYDGYGSPNSSYYPFTAYIENGEGLKNNEYVGFTTTVGGDMNSESICLEKAFIREEDGKYYVYIADENNRLKKQYITGKSVDGYSMLITSGLTPEDRITFPYGKGVKEGAKVKDATVDAFYM